MRRLRSEIRRRERRVHPQVVLENVDETDQNTVSTAIADVRPTTSKQSTLKSKPSTSSSNKPVSLSTPSNKAECTVEVHADNCAFFPDVSEFTLPNQPIIDDV